VTAVEAAVGHGRTVSRRSPSGRAQRGGQWLTVIVQEHHVQERADRNERRSQVPWEGRSSAQKRSEPAVALL
jgi:hypothetical protein